MTVLLQKEAFTAINMIHSRTTRLQLQVGKLVESAIAQLEPVDSGDAEHTDEQFVTLSEAVMSIGPDLRRTITDALVEKSLQELVAPYRMQVNGLEVCRSLFRWHPAGFVPNCRTTCCKRP